MEAVGSIAGKRPKLLPGPFVVNMEKREVAVFKENFGKVNVLEGWYKVKNPLVVIKNFLLMSLAKSAPSLTVRNFLYRQCGVKIGRHVSIAAGVMLDFFFPELIEIGDNVIIGYKSTILAHEFLHTEWKTGNVKIGDNVLVGAWVLVMPGVTVGAGAQVAAFSLVNKTVSAGERVGGVPIKKIGQ